MSQLMIEKVAKILADKCQFAIDPNAPYAKVMFIEAAKAAIAAMRELDDETLDWVHLYHSISSEWTKEIYQTIIDKILE